MNRTKELRTARLLLREVRPEDAAGLHQELGLVPEMWAYTGWNPYGTLAEAESKIAEDLKSDALGETCSWVMEWAGECAGLIAAYDYDPAEGSIEIGYSVFRRFWGRGLATEAAGAVVAYLAELPDIRSVRAWAEPENVGSVKVLEGAGLRQVGREGDRLTFEKRMKGSSL